MRKIKSGNVPFSRGGILILLMSAAFVLFWQISVMSAQKWYSFNEGMAKGLAEGKPVLVDFYADWCSWCKVMDKETFSDREVASILNAQFVLVRIDVESNQKIRYKNKDFSPRQFQMYMQVTGLPTIAFFDKKGELVTLLPGFVPAKDFKPVLGYIAVECYKKEVSFKEYVAASMKCEK